MTDKEKIIDLINYLTKNITEKQAYLWLQNYLKYIYGIYENAPSLTIEANSEEEAQTIHKALKESCRIIQTPQEPYCGHVKYTNIVTGKSDLSLNYNGKIRQTGDTWSVEPQISDKVYLDLKEDILSNEYYYKDNILFKSITSLASTLEWETYTKNNKAENSAKIKAENILGSGTESVYMYYFPSSKELADYKHESYWRCKIGKSSDDAISRIIDQMNESNSEIPIVPYIIKCDDGLKLEREIHKELFRQKKHIKDAMGSEWFYTNPEDFIDIYKHISI